ncbi:DEKNAAC102681 [Brettanomyces naardenensis]|uniref:DEKNAAC102681 n=1 Tax=Brettanomyces naardenensis TaxID=13370 RepID=A0A448YK43_BRENA|nr:DEKNAAC102681 [Brettanomyces naardenensis]
MEASMSQIHDLADWMSFGLVTKLRRRLIYDKDEVQTCDDDCPQLAVQSPTFPTPFSKPHQLLTRESSKSRRDSAQRTLESGSQYSGSTKVETPLAAGEKFVTRDPGVDQNLMAQKASLSSLAYMIPKNAEDTKSRQMAVSMKNAHQRAKKLISPCTLSSRKRSNRSTEEVQRLKPPGSIPGPSRLRQMTPSHSENRLNRGYESPQETLVPPGPSYNQITKTITASSTASSDINGSFLLVFDDHLTPGLPSRDGNTYGD